MQLEVDNTYSVSADHMAVVTECLQGSEVLF
jgi:hypothetical protein